MIENLDALISDAARANGLDRSAFSALIYSEYNPRVWVNPDSGATGPAQLLPSTAADLGVSDINDPAENINGGAKYFRQLLDKNGGDLKTAVAKYKGIRDPEKPENARMLKSYFDWLKKKSGDPVSAAEGYRFDPPSIGNIAKKLADKFLGDGGDTEKETGSGSSSGSSWSDIMARLKKPQFLGIIILILMLFSAALFELSVKSALKP